MNQKTYYQIADVIQQYRTWLKVVDTEQVTPMRLFVDGELKTCMCKTLTLQSYREHYGFVRTRKWHITEYDIGRGVVALIRKDPGARKRVEREKLTLTDVEYIIEKASFGIIKLELDRFDYD